MKIIEQPLEYEVRPSEHFIMNLIKRGFGLSTIVNIYNFVETNKANIEIGKEFEISTGKDTFIASVDKNKNIHLITGWMGNRSKR